MLKVSVDRTLDPTHASWRHRQTPAWSLETIHSSPWLPHVFSWMAGQPPPKVDHLDSAPIDAAQLVSAVLHERDSRKQARACWHLAGTQQTEVLTELLQLLSECTAGLSTDTAAQIPTDANEVRLATAIAACGARASALVCARLAESELGAHERAVLLDVLLDCVTGGEETARHRQCFVDAALHKNDWVRHNALQGLEMTSASHWIDGSVARECRALILNAVDDLNSMVAFNAISALYNLDMARGSYKRTVRDLQAAAAQMQARGREAMLCFKASRIAEFNHDCVAASHALL